MSVDISFSCRSWWYHDRPRLTEGQDLRLVREPDNPHDMYAVEIYAGRKKLGYVDAAYSEKVSKALERGEKLVAMVDMAGDEELGINPLILIMDEDTELEHMREAAARDAETDRMAKMVVAGVVGVCLFILISLFLIIF